MMKIGQAKIAEVFLDGSVRIECSSDLIPAVGQYVLAHKNASSAPLPVSLFYLELLPNGFRFAPPTPFDWKPGDLINVRGPIGSGFHVPDSAKRIALIAFDKSIARLYGLMSLSLKQNREVVLVCNSAPQDLPEAVEVQPLQAFQDVLQWAEYAAFDIQRENINQLKEMLKEQDQLPRKLEAQILIHTSMPCGGIAECGVCALTLNHEWKMICKEGPVFRLLDVL
jgi:NAD(P)H-flavin reductase